MKSRVVRISASLVVLLGLYLIYQWWVRPPTVEYDNLKYIQLMSTAVSSRNTEWLNRVETAVKQRHASAEMSDSELAHFFRVIGTARTGDWKAAERQCFGFAEAQLGRRRTKAPSHDHLGTEVPPQNFSK
jgi:hypothetical protein